MPARRKHPGRGIQQRRETGRRYLRLYGWAALAANCALLVLLAERYFGGMLVGNGLRGRPVDIRDPGYDATPLGYALYDCLVEKRHPEGEFARVVKALHVNAYLEVTPENESDSELG